MHIRWIVQPILKCTSKTGEETWGTQQIAATSKIPYILQLCIVSIALVLLGNWEKSLANGTAGKVLGLVLLIQWTPHQESPANCTVSKSAGKLRLRL